MEPDCLRAFQRTGERNDYRAADHLRTEGKAAGNRRCTRFAVRSHAGATRMFEMSVVTKLAKPRRACAGSELGNRRGFSQPSAIGQLQAATALDGAECRSASTRVFDGTGSKWIGAGAEGPNHSSTNRDGRNDDRKGLTNGHHDCPRN